MGGERLFEGEGINRGEDSSDGTFSPEMCLRGLEKTDKRGLLGEAGNGLIDAFLPSWFSNS